MNIEFEQVFVDTFSVMIDIEQEAKVKELKKVCPGFKRMKTTSKGVKYVIFQYLNTADLKVSVDCVKHLLSNLKTYNLLDEAIIQVDVSYDTGKCETRLLKSKGWEESPYHPGSEFIKKNTKTNVKYYSKKAEVERRDNKWLKGKLKNNDRMARYEVEEYDFWRLEISGSPKTNQEVDDLVRNFKKLIK